jgi:GDP-L-fucose synthase
MKTKKTVLICGATGFIGRNLANYFALNPDYQLHLVWHKRPAYEIPNAIWHQADLTNPSSVDRLVKNFDILIQAAATTSGAKDIVGNPSVHVTDNVIMNSLIFRSAQENNIGHLIFFSCTIMYQSGLKPVTESDFDANSPINPKYFGAGYTKLYLEKMCEFYAGLGSCKFTAIRHSNIYGPFDKFDLEKSHVFGASITKVVEADREIVVWGDGSEARDFLHVSDLCNFVNLVLEKSSAKFELYNCGCGKLISVKDLIGRIMHHAEKSLVIIYDTNKPTIEMSVCLDCSKAREKLGWQALVSLDEGICDTLAWLDNVN